MLILFAVGVVTGTILSFELGLLWPRFMEQWGEVFGFGVRARGLLLLRRGDLHRDLRLRLGPALAARPPARRAADRHRRHRRLGLRDRGQRLDERPARVRRSAPPARSPNVRPFEALFNGHLWHEVVHMYLAGFLVAGFLAAGVYAVRLAARAGATATTGPASSSRWRSSRSPRRRRSSSATGRRGPSPRTSRPSSRRSRGSTRPPRAPA